MTHILVSYLIRIMISPVHSESKTSLDLSNNIDNYLINFSQSEDQPKNWLAIGLSKRS